MQAELSLRNLKGRSRRQRCGSNEAMQVQQSWTACAASRSDQVCLVSSDLLQMHLALAGTQFQLLVLLCAPSWKRVASKLTSLQAANARAACSGTAPSPEAQQRPLDGHPPDLAQPSAHSAALELGTSSCPPALLSPCS